nr:MAG TPA: hypothetical protein [Caudoviricetes sp.]
MYMEIYVEFFVELDSFFIDWNFKIFIIFKIPGDIYYKVYIIYNIYISGIFKFFYFIAIKRPLSIRS